MPFAAGAGRHDTAPEGRTRSQAATAACQGESRALGIGVLPQLAYNPSSKGLRSVRPYRGHVFVRTGFRKLRFRSPAPCKHAFAGSQPVCSARASIKTRARTTGTSLRARLAVAAVLQRLNGLERWEANLKNSNLGMLGRLAMRRRSTSLHPTTLSFHRQLCTAVSMQGPAEQ